MTRPAAPDAYHTVAEVLDAWPQTIRVFLDHRMHCVGCAMAGFDTIAEAVANYGGALEPFVAELARAAVEASRQDPQ
jgi:hybrid cluster-associated redox disulfide protein